MAVMVTIVGVEGLFSDFHKACQDNPCVDCFRADQDFDRIPHGLYHRAQIICTDRRHGLTIYSRWVDLITPRGFVKLLGPDLATIQV